MKEAVTFNLKAVLDIKAFLERGSCIFPKDCPHCCLLSFIFLHYIETGAALKSRLALVQVQRKHTDCGLSLKKYSLPPLQVIAKTSNT